MISMATVPRRMGMALLYGVLWPCVLRDSGGGRLYCSHAPSHHRYVGAALEGAILAACREPVFLRPASGSRSSCGRLLGVGHLMVIFGKVFEVGSPSGSRPVR